MYFHFVQWHLPQITVHINCEIVWLLASKLSFGCSHPSSLPIWQVFFTSHCHVASCLSCEPLTIALHFAMSCKGIFLELHVPQCNVSIRRTQFTLCKLVLCCVHAARKCRSTKCAQNLENLSGYDIKAVNRHVKVLF